MNNEEKLLYTIGEVDPKYVPSDKKKKHLILKCTAVGTAAAAAVMGFAVFRSAFLTPDELASPFDGEGIDIVETGSPLTEADSALQETDSTLSEADEADIIAPEANELPKIPYNGFCYNSDYEESTLGNIGYSINYGYRMIDGNPWSEEQGITSLPVYKNLAYGGDYEYPDFYMGKEAMEEMAEKAADALGVTIQESEFFNVEYESYQNNMSEESSFAEDSIPYEYRQDEWYYNVICSGEAYGVESVEIAVWSRGSMIVLFNNNDNSSLDPHWMNLPEEYMNDEKALSDYLKECFKELLDIDNPSDNIIFDIYNVTDDPVQNILNYSLENNYFVVRGNELVSIIMNKYLSMAELVGEYEILTPEEAKEKLLTASENFEVREGLDHTEPSIMPTEENIVGVNIIYSDTSFDDLEYFKPYYVFYVKLDDYYDETICSLYYVPALADEYVLD